MTTFHTILGVTPSILLIVLFMVLMRVRAHREFSWFVAYVTYAVCADAARFFTRNHQSAYFFTYWGTDAGYALLGVLALYQVFNAVFRNLTRLWYVHLLFPAMLVFAIVLAFVRYEMFPSRIPGTLLTAIIVGELAVRLLQVLIFCLLVALVFLFGLHWRQYAFGIAAGFGVYATTALTATTEFYESGTRLILVWGTALLLSYIVAVLIWIWFFARTRKHLGDSQTRSRAMTAETVMHYKEAARRILWR